MGLTNEKGVDILIDTQQFGEACTDAAGDEVLSSGDYVRMGVTMGGGQMKLLLSPDEAESVGLELARYAGRLRRARAKAAGKNPLRDYMTTAFRTDPK